MHIKFIFGLLAWIGAGKARDEKSNRSGPVRRTPDGREEPPGKGTDARPDRGQPSHRYRRLSRLAGA